MDGWGVIGRWPVVAGRWASNLVARTAVTMETVEKDACQPIITELRKMTIRHETLVLRAIAGYPQNTPQPNQPPR